MQSFSPSFDTSTINSTFSAISSNVTFDAVKPHTTLNTFSDSHGRSLLLRGLNVAGDAKYPQNNPLAGTSGFYDVSNVSYTGKPFKDAAEARLWWEQLRSWGVGVVRLVVVWEALEPREIGVYDEEYMNYVHTIVKEAEKAGLRVFIDGHQDCVRDYPQRARSAQRKLTDGNSGRDLQVAPAHRYGHFILSVSIRKCSRTYAPLLSINRRRAATYLRPPADYGLRTIPNMRSRQCSPSFLLAKCLLQRPCTRAPTPNSTERISVMSCALPIPARSHT